VETSGFPRTTQAGVEITAAGTVESLPLPACFTLPEGTDCEVDVPVVIVTAAAGDQLVRLRLRGTPEAIKPPNNFGDLGFPMSIRVLETDGDMVVVAVSVRPAGNATVRLVAGGEVVDAVRPDRGLAVLASSVGYDDVQLIDDQTGDPIASCPLGGMLVGDVIYPCTPPPVPPVTTIPG